MLEDRAVAVYLLPSLVPCGRLTGGVAVVIDVLRATTTVIHALVAGCTAVRPCAEVEEARTLADQMCAGRVLLGGERGGRPVAGFDLGNSPGEYVAKVCRGTTLVLTTTNGTRAMVRAAEAERGALGRFRQLQCRLRTTAAGKAANSYHLCGHRRRRDTGGYPFGRSTGRFPLRHDRCMPQRRRPARLGLLRESWPSASGRFGNQQGRHQPAPAWL